MNHEQLVGVVAQFPRLRALVVGDLMVDEYLWGTVERISPEAPVQVVDIRREEVTLGGAGNVAKNLVSLGARVQVAGVVDDSLNGTVILSELARLGADSAGVFRETGRVSSRKTRILSLDKNQQLLRIDRETRNATTVEAERSLLQYCVDALSGVDLVILSDYLKGVLSDTLCAAVVRAAQALQRPAIVDPKASCFDRYRHATIVTPNRREAELASGLRIIDDASLEAAGQALLRSTEAAAVLITLGKDGMALFQGEGPGRRIPTRAKQVFDVTGAGDTVVATVGLGIASGLPLADAAELANIAAGVVVGKVGTATVTAEEIVAHGREPFELRKLQTVETLGPLLRRRREEQKKIVFTNGCFDLLHVGHIKLLEQARSLGDVLVLGLNSDASIRRLKGSSRPIMQAAERVSILSSLACVDLIVVFDEDTPLALIKEVRPDVLVKGSDYSQRKVVGAAEVESWGGQVMFIEAVDGISTTAMISRIRQQAAGAARTAAAKQRRERRGRCASAS